VRLPQPEIYKAMQHTWSERQFTFLDVWGVDVVYEELSEVV